MSDSTHPILSKLTSLGKPRAGMSDLPPASPPAMEGVTQAPASREVNEALVKGDLDAELVRYAQIKNLMPVIEQDETRARELRTGHIQRLANQAPSRVHGEDAVGRGSHQEAKATRMQITINPTHRQCVVKTAENVETVITALGVEVTAKISW